MWKMLTLLCSICPVSRTHYTDRTLSVGVSRELYSNYSSKAARRLENSKTVSEEFPENSDKLCM